MPESAEKMTDNEALTESVHVLRDILSALTVKYSRVEKQNSVISAAGTATRAQRASAVKTCMTVISGGTVTVREGGAIVAIVEVGKTWTSAATGGSEITATSTAGSTVEFATYIA